MATTLTICKVQLAAGDGMVWPLTGCCGASGKGAGAGVVCRGCYRPVKDGYGMAATDLPGVAAMVAVLGGCPCPDECAREAWWQLTERG